MIAKNCNTHFKHAGHLGANAVPNKKGLLQDSYPFATGAMQRSMFVWERAGSEAKNDQPIQSIFQDLVLRSSPKAITQNPKTDTV